MADATGVARYEPAHGVNAPCSDLHGTSVNVSFRYIPVQTDKRASRVRNEPSLHQIDANCVVGTDADGATSTAQGVQRPLCRDEVDNWIPSVKCVDHRSQTRRGLMDTTLTCQNWC